MCVCVLKRIFWDSLLSLSFEMGMCVLFNDKLVICIMTNAMHTMYILTYSISVKI